MQSTRRLRYLAEYLRNFSGHRLEKAFLWAPSLQKLVRRRRWDQAARAGVQLVDPGQLRAKLHEGLAYLSRDGKEQVGDYLEFGVFNGTSMICMYQVLQEMKLHHVRLFGFDSFEGLPVAAATDDGGVWKPGDFASPYEVTKERLVAASLSPGRAVLIKGWFNETLNADTIARLGISHVGVIMVDADIYSSSKQALSFCAPLIKREALLIMDDWYAHDGLFLDGNGGQPRALKEFLAERSEFRKVDLGPYSYFGRLAGHVFTLKR
jgi:O-methyltransferase